jgi:hypothetical protein
MFFTDSRQHFFRPLTGKYREVVVECLRLLYRRLYTDLTDVGHLRQREQVLDIFAEAIARAPLLDAEPETDGSREGEGRFKTQRELAGFILHLLLDHGWLERQVDEASLQSHYAFSRTGRLFTQPFAESDSQSFRTRNRNTRNTRNSLQAFLEQGEVYDLLDAHEYSERIISDFTDVIAELEERKRQLVRDVEARQLIEQASDAFFGFMETVFKPDLEVRLSADSVEKYRDQIATLIKQIRRRRKFGGSGEHADKDWRAVMEIRLRKLLPGRALPGQSLLENLLCAIEERLRAACDTMLPALRKSLNSFTQRADIIMRQLSYIHAQGDDRLLEACRRLGAMPPARQDALLLQAGAALAELRPGYIDPGQIQLKTRASRARVSGRIGAEGALDRDARRDLFIAQALDQAFSVQSAAIRRYVAGALRSSGRIHTRQLPVADARDLLAVARAIEVGAHDNLSAEFHFVVSAPQLPLVAGLQVLDSSAAAVDGDPYFTCRDDFTIELCAAGNPAAVPATDPATGVNPL